MLDKIKKVKETVKIMLTEHAILRDDDNKLIAFIWYHEAVANNPDLTAKDFLNFYARGEVSNAEGIRRARQKVQEQEKSLRGTNYKGRMAEEEVVREGIKEV